MSDHQQPDALIDFMLASAYSNLVEKRTQWFQQGAERRIEESASGLVRLWQGTELVAEAHKATIEESLGSALTLGLERDRKAAPRLSRGVA